MRSRPASAKNPDSYILDLCARNPNLLVPHWLIASFMYYVEDNPLLSDATFDAIVTQLGDQWDTVEHRHKFLIKRDMLKSGFYITDYPLIVQGAANALRRELAATSRPSGGPSGVRVKRLGASGPAQRTATEHRPRGN